jgi:hypothetical protein
MPEIADLRAFGDMRGGSTGAKRNFLTQPVFQGEYARLEL